MAWSEFSRIRRGTQEAGVIGNGIREIRLGAMTALRPTYGRLEGGRRYCTGGSSYAMVVDFSCGVHAVSCLPYGISDDPASPHFADQMPLYVKGAFKPAWFWPDELKANAESDQVLSAGN